MGVEERGAIYKPTGVLRDMVPNHLFTLLSTMTMKPPNIHLEKRTHKPAETMRGIDKHLGRRMSAALSGRLQAAVLRLANDGYGRTSYALSDYGLDGETEEQFFRGYV